MITASASLATLPTFQLLCALALPNSKLLLNICTHVYMKTYGCVHAYDLLSPLSVH